MGDYLIVGVSTDRLNAEKGKRSFFSQAHRAECVAALKCVDEVFFEDSLERKDEYIREHGADLLVMGNDWQGRFDWVSCEVSYLPRTEGVSSTDVKTSIGGHFKVKKVLFGDTYIKKHYDCAMSLVNEMTSANMAPVFTQTSSLPEGIDCDCLVFFNLPAEELPSSYDGKPRVLIDHGASHLKWFLADEKRFDFFDVIVTAGPDHVRSLLTFFSDGPSKDKVRSGGFIKSKLLLSPPLRSRERVAAACGLDPARPIVLFAPTWYISNNLDMAAAVRQIADIPNHVALLHPETAHLDVSGLNVVPNEGGIISELLKHCDCLVSDLSSTIFEAAALSKPVVQVLLREYSDNNAGMFDYPYTAGTAELFVGGLCVRPQEVAGAVQRLLDGDADALAAIAAMQARLLHGTSITEASASSIVAEVSRACDALEEGRPVDRTPSRPSNAIAHDNLMFTRSRVIANGGGDFASHHASNSLEAVTAARDVVDFVELDFVRSADGVIVAHDGFEHRHGLGSPFASISTKEFLASKFDSELTPLSLEQAVLLCTQPGKALVCDIKSNREDYDYVAGKIRDEAVRLGVQSQVILQCYEKRDFNTALRLGFSRVLLAVWKWFYRNPLGEDAFEFVRDCAETDLRAVVGIMIPYVNKHMPAPSVTDPRIDRFLSFWKRVYIHGAPEEEYSRILNRNFGISADALSARYQFRDAPRHFPWMEYLFLNPDVANAGHSNPVAAMLHYLQYGSSEGRPIEYAVPPDFSYPIYVDMNPGLRNAGISGVHTANAHWTRHGRSEGRKYRRG